MAEIKKYLDQAGLEALVGQIKVEDGKVLQGAKDYADGLAKNYDAAGSAATAESNAKAYADGLAGNYDAAGSAAAVDAKLTTEVGRATGEEARIEGLANAAQGKADANEAAIAAINNETTGILKKAKDYTDAEVAKVQGEVDALEGLVGELPENTTATTVIGYVDAKTSGIASDERVNAIDERLTQAEKDIDAIEADYLTSADKTELEGKVTAEENARKAADEELAADIKAIADDYLKAADKNELTQAIADAKADAIATVLGEGVDEDFDTLKEVAEWILSDTSGAAKLQTEVAQLIIDVDAVEERMDTAEGDIDALEEEVAKKVNKTAYDEKVAALEGADSAMAGRLDAIEEQLGDGEGSVSDQISDAKAEAIESATTTAAADATEKANAAEKNAKDYADGLNTAMNTRVEALEAIDHEHANKDLLDTYTQTEANLADAVAKKHEHGNKAVLDGITAAQVTAWDAAEGNAKTYADGLNTEMTTKVDAIDARVTQNTTDIATKADADDFDAAVLRLEAVEAKAAANESAIAGFSAIETADIEKLFA